MRQQHKVILKDVALLVGDCNVAYLASPALNQADGESLWLEWRVVIWSCCYGWGV